MTNQTDDDFTPTRYCWMQEGMDEYIRGDWVCYDDYENLLNAYEELKFRMEGFEE